MTKPSRPTRHDRSSTPPRPSIVAPVPRWQQIAGYLRDEIMTGRFPAGQPLPSEEALAAEFGVSRPTVRQGIATLVTEGLLTVRRPYGTIVRDPYARPTHVDRRAITAPDYSDAGVPVWVDAAEPVYLRTDATTSHADLLGIDPGEPMLTREVVQSAQPGNSQGDERLRRYVRLYVPFRVAADLNPPWADSPHLPAPAEVYAWFAQHGQRPMFTEFVRARMPVGDETRDLNMPGGTPLLVITRLALAQRPLAVEEIRVSADQAELAYSVAIEPRNGQATP